jgi:hypothetical protein
MFELPGLFTTVVRSALFGTPVEPAKPKPGSLPRLVYKYLPAERVDLLQSGQVRFSQFAALNDPLEFGAHVPDSAIEDACRRLAFVIYVPLTLAFSLYLPITLFREVRKTDAWRISTSKQRQTVFRQTLAVPISFIKSMRVLFPKGLEDLRIALYNLIRIELKQDGVMIFSCSALPDVIPMWAHYAGNHTGFQIGFEPARAFTITSKRNVTRPLLPSRVLYMKKMPHLKNGWDVLRKLSICKLIDWKYENEWRFALDRKSIGDTGKIDNLGRPLYLYALNIASIKEVTFGYLANDELISQVRSALSGRDVEYLKLGDEGARHPLAALGLP